MGAADQTPLTLQSERGPGGRGQPGAAVGSLGPQTQGHARLCPRGFFQAGPAVRLIEPLAEAGEEGPHALYLAQHLQQEAGTCGVNDSSLESILGPRVSAAFRPRWSEPRETRYVELFVVTDSKEFQRFGSREAVRQRVLEVVNHVDKLYQELNFRVVLVGLEMWNGGDKIQISSQPDATLDNFLAWRTRELVGRQAHDNVQLITGVDFTGTTVGLAKVSTMCSSSSGAVNQDHSQNPIGVASTMAHEMGHNLGMDHDENVAGCYCPVPREGGGCVMAASIGSQYPRKFSQCSQADLETFVEKPRTACLLDAPDLDRLVGGPVCGNGFLERGEQCDCGRPEDCQNRCCNASTCLLAEGAECAHGTCCHECRVKPAGELCRPVKDQCDLGEHCDGQQPTCPEDAFRENGTPCPGGYCYNGACPTLARRCQDLWGPGSRVAVETCFLYSISKGCGAGVPLPFGRVNKCGTLFCEGGQKTPERGYCTLTISSGVCRVIVQDGSTEYEPVPKGTKCGEQQVCWDGFCQGLHVYRSRNCSAQCNSHGVRGPRAQPATSPLGLRDVPAVLGPPAPRQTEGQGWHPGDVGSCWDLPRRGLLGMSQVSEPVDTWAGWSGVKHLVLSSDTGKARAPGLCPLVSPPGEESSPPRRPAPCGDACFAQQALQCLGGLRLSAPVVKPWWRWS